MAGSAQLTTGFPEGNLEQWSGMLKTQVPRIYDLLLKTIDPLICASLIELVGSNTRFRKKMGVVTPNMKGNSAQSFDVRLVYSVPDFIGFTGPDEPIIQDRMFILKRLQKVPGVRFSDTTVNIQPKDGSVTVSFIVPVGYAQ
jgi:hypothetical protein